MKFNDKLYQLRVNKNLSQEKLAEQLLVSRQTITKWEAGKAFPEIDKLLPLSRFFGISIDALLDESDCNDLTFKQTALKTPYEQLITFLLHAKRSTFAANTGQQEPRRSGSREYYFENEPLSYLDSFFGTDIFSGQEVVYEDGLPIWTMNYVGRTLDLGFSSNFLKEALLAGTEKHPYRGPLFYANGQYSYHNRVNGAFNWFDGCEEIFFAGQRVYECKYHGGLLI